MKLSELRDLYHKRQKFAGEYEKKKIHPLVSELCKRRQEMKKVVCADLSQRGIGWERIAASISSIRTDKLNFSILLPLGANWCFIVKSHATGDTHAGKHTARITLDIDTPLTEVVDAAINLVAMESMSNGGADEQTNPV